MKNRQKKQTNKKRNYKQYNRWIPFIPVIYIVIPALGIFLLPNLFLKPLATFMSTMKVAGAEIVNSQHAINQVITPFCNVILLIFGFVIAYWGIRVIERKIFKQVDYRISAKKWLIVIEIIIVLLTVGSVIYANAQEFPHEQYGYSIETLRNIVNVQEVKNIPLEKIPTISSLGLRSNGASAFYNILMRIARLFYLISNNFDIFIALAGGIVLPLKNYVEFKNEND